MAASVSQCQRRRRNGRPAHHSRQIAVRRRCRRKLCRLRSCEWKASVAFAHRQHLECARNLRGRWPAICPCRERRHAFRIHVVSVVFTKSQRALNESSGIYPVPDVQFSKFRLWQSHSQIPDASSMAAVVSRPRWDLTPLASAPPLVGLALCHCQGDPHPKGPRGATHNHSILEKGPAVE